eukprot:403369183
MNVQCGGALEAQYAQIKLWYKSFYFMGWVTNTNDLLIAMGTTFYCYNKGLFMVLMFNDGGQTLYDCLDSTLAKIRYG